MVKINKLFNISSAVVLSSVFLEFVFNVNDIIIPILHSITAAFSIVLFFVYNFQLNWQDKSNSFIELILKDPELDEIQSEYKKLLASLKRIIPRNMKKLLFSILFPLIITSIIYNTLIMNIVNYMYPLAFSICLIIHENFYKKDHLSVSLLEQWISKASQDIQTNWNYLQQYRDPFLDAHFVFLNKKLVNLSLMQESFKSQLKALPATLNSTKIQNLFTIFNELIWAVYEIRGMVSTLMKLIIQLRNFQMKVIENKEQQMKLETEEATLRRIEEKKEAFHTLDEDIQSKHDLANLKINEMEQKIQLKTNLLEQTFQQKTGDWEKTFAADFSQKSSNLEAKLYELFTTFSHKNQEFFDNWIMVSTNLHKNINAEYKQLVRKSLEFYTVKLQLESQTLDFDNYKRLVNLYFEEIYSGSDHAQKYGILQLLCQVYHKVNANKYPILPG